MFIYQKKSPRPRNRRSKLKYADEVKRFGHIDFLTMAPILGPILVASLPPKIWMTSIDVRSKITFYMGNTHVSFCHRKSTKKMS